MRIGFTLPQFGPLAHQIGQVAGFARRIEEAGGDSLWVGDRLLAAVHPTVGYGGGPTIPAEFNAILDPFTLLTIAATVTDRVRLGSNVLNLPWYAPAVLARSLTSIDLLSEGRLTLGAGIGWSPEEYDAAGIPMKERGARIEEGLDALEELWTADPAEHHGTHWSVPLTHASLKPAQRPRPPIYLAGFSAPAMRRVARRADGWLPVCRPGAGAFDPRASIEAPLERVREMAGEHGRKAEEIGALLRVYPTAGTGVGQIVEAIHRVERETSVRDVFVDLLFLAGSVAHSADLAEEILREYRAG